METEGRLKMSSQRYVSTSFWNDPWILDECTSDERYVYLYLLTSPNSNIAGIYELSLRTAELHTGYDRDQLKRIMERFAEAKKAHYYNGYVIIPKWPTHQRWQQRSKIRDGIVAVLQGLPRDVLEHAKAYGYQFDMDLVDTTIIARNVRQGVSGSLRKAVIDASEGKCARCGKEADKLEIHHIVPVKEGGKNSKDNLEALCIDCHKSVHIPYMDVHNYSDSDTDTDSDTDANAEAHTPRKHTANTHYKIDGYLLPMNQARYDRLCEEYGRHVTNEYIERAYRYSLKKRGDIKQYKDYAAAAEDFMKRDNVEKRKAETAGKIDVRSLNGVSYD